LLTDSSRGGLWRGFVAVGDVGAMNPEADDAHHPQPLLGAVVHRIHPHLLSRLHLVWGVQLHSKECVLAID